MRAVCLRVQHLAARRASGGQGWGRQAAGRGRRRAHVGTASDVCTRDVRLRAQPEGRGASTTRLHTAPPAAHLVEARNLRLQLVLLRHQQVVLPLKQRQPLLRAARGNQRTGMHMEMREGIPGLYLRQGAGAPSKLQLHFAAWQS